MFGWIKAMTCTYVCIQIGRGTWQGLMWDMPPHVYHHAVRTGQL